MSLIEKIVDIVSIEMEEPIAYGGFHIVCIFCVVILSLSLSRLLLSSSPRTFRLVIACSLFVMLAFEVIKEVGLSFVCVGGELAVDYPWGMLPFQLCSTPLYVLPLLAFLPCGRVRDGAAAYTMTYALIGGMAVYLFPATVFSTGLVVTLQTMVHHGLQIVTGVCTAAYYRHCIDRRFFLSGAVVFTVAYAIANFLNTVGYSLLVSVGAIAEGDGFNMFFVSPRADQPTPLLAELLKSLPPPVLILGYYFLMLFCSFLIMRIFRFVYKSQWRR